MKFEGEDEDWEWRWRFGLNGSTARRPFFWHTLLYINFSPFQKISAQGRLRSRHQVRSSDSTSKNIYDNAVTTVFKVSISNFQKLIRTSIPIKVYSRNFDFGDLRSGRFCDVAIIRQWENVQMLFLPKLRVGTCYSSQDVLILGHSQWPVCGYDPVTSMLGHSRSYEVKFVFASSFW